MLDLVVVDGKALVVSLLVNQFTVKSSGVTMHRIAPGGYGNVFSFYKMQAEVM
jgi:hypothetical protein